MKLKDFIICDDIRTEIGNKFSLMGIYNDALNFTVPENLADSWPKMVHLGFFIRLGLQNLEELRNIGKFVLESTQNDEINFKAEQIFSGEVNDNNPLNQLIISVVFDQIKIHSIGEMDLSLSVYNKKNELMAKFNYPGNMKVSVVTFPNPR